MPPLATHDSPAQLGQYRLLRKLGQGGMGTVYEALHLHLQSTVAVKVLRLDRGEPGERVARFTREMAAIGRLVDSHIVRALDAGVVDGTHYLAMEYVDGCDAGRILARGSALPVAEACEIARQGALGLAAIERAGLVHRDIKPSNLLVTREGLVKIADLGLARLSSAEQEEGGLTGSWQVVGTSDYMSPEQAEGSESLDIRTDLYSLGCTLFKLLAGHAPFESARHPTLPSKLLAHRQEPVPQLPADVVAAAPGLQALLERLLAKRPGERLSSPLELAQQLEPYTPGCDLPALVAKWMPPRAAPEAPRGCEPLSLSGETFGSAQNPTESYAPGQATTPIAATAAWPWGLAMAGGLALLAAMVVALLPGLLPGTNMERESADKPLAANGSPEKETPVVPPEKKGAETAAAPFELDRGPALRWQRLLERAPAPTFWPAGRGLATWQWQEDLQQVVATTDDLGLLALGSTDSDQFTLQIRLHQGRWSGGVGCFFGYRWMEDAQKRPIFLCQQLRLHENVAAGGKQSFSITRGTLRSSYAADGSPQVEQRQITSEEVPFPIGEQSCELTVVRGSLESVRWNGQTLRRLVEAEINRRFAAIDYHGPCGIVVSRASVVVRDAQFMRLEAVR